MLDIGFDNTYLLAMMIELIHMAFRQIFLSLLALVAFGVGVAEADCAANTSRPWGEARLEVNSLGQKCSDAVLVLAVRDKAGAVLWAQAHVSKDLMTFQNLPKLSPKTMVKQLADWIAVDDRLADSAALPDWPPKVKDGVLPPGAEFPLRVDEGLDRDGYLALRKAKVPILCYVAGTESQRCIVLEKGGVVEIGTQSFPG